jgi:hypothetical protein
MKIHDAYKRTQKIQSKIDTVPYKVWTTFAERQFSMDIMGDQISINDGDYKSLDEIREALDWMVQQFGGSTEWNK